MTATPYVPGVAGVPDSTPKELGCRLRARPRWPRCWLLLRVRRGGSSVVYV
ncbi:hypothetical protein [Longispora fulva]|uniref:Uncharacterized protein n=1 Tax=Longispora fulva TaxID=619741 RepID=A0A8J7KKA1_9ACTN|nr:hypothetical protein [Longispora fulva]MBG6136431.1 hypothetical protein [Longispora fulva]